VCRRNRDGFFFLFEFYQIGVGVFGTGWRDIYIQEIGEICRRVRKQSVNLDLIWS
jgi:hypothetical protein